MMQALKLLGIVVGSADNKLHARFVLTFSFIGTIYFYFDNFGRSFDEGEEAARMIEEQGESDRQTVSWKFMAASLQIKLLLKFRRNRYK